MDWEGLTLVVARRTLAEPNTSFAGFASVVSPAWPKASIAKFNEGRASSRLFRFDIVERQGERCGVKSVLGDPNPGSFERCVYFRLRTPRALVSAVFGNRGCWVT